MKQHGLTLLELMATLAILIILVTVAMPALAELVNRQRAESYIRQFSQHLAFARIQAVATQRSVQFCPVSTDECLANWQQFPLQIRILHDNDPLVLREIPALYQYHRLVYSRNQLNFRRDGSLDSLENGTFYYCPQAQYQWHYQLTVNQAGRNRLRYLDSSCPV